MNEIWSKTYIGLHAKCPLFLSVFSETWIFSTDFRKNPQISNLMKICPVGHADGQTDITKLMVAFLEFAKRLKMWPICTVTSLMSNTEGCVSNAISVPSHPQPYVRQTEEFQYGWRFTCDSGINQRFLGGKNTSSEKRSWKLMKYVERSGDVPSIGNLAPRGGQADETRRKQDEMLHDWLGPGLPILAYCLLTLRSRPAQPFMWFGQHRQNLVCVRATWYWLPKLKIEWQLCVQFYVRFCTHQGR
jgi:hypothetical protein